MDEKEKRKTEVRARMAEQAAAAKKKKGFMTPARKKKLRVSHSRTFSTYFHFRYIDRNMPYITHVTQLDITKKY